MQYLILHHQRIVTHSQSPNSIAVVLGRWWLLNPDWIKFWQPCRSSGLKVIQIQISKYVFTIWARPLINFLSTKHSDKKHLLKPKQCTLLPSRNDSNKLRNTLTRRWKSAAYSKIQTPCPAVAPWMLRIFEFWSRTLALDAYISGKLETWI